MRHKRLLLGLLLLLGVGFASVSATLLITGNVKIATNNADFDVKFTKAVLDGTDISETAISPNGKTITFSTKDLSTVGDRSKLDFEVTNNSTLYDAEVSVECSANGTNKDHYEITKEVANSIEAQTTGIGKVEVSLLKAAVNDFSETFTCTLTAIAKERTRMAVTYYALEDPLTAADKSTDYTTLGKNVFLKLDANGVQKSICIVRKGILECFKNNNWEEEKKHIQDVFSDVKCTSDGSSFDCYASDFHGYVNSAGDVGYQDYNGNFQCSLFSDDTAYCYS